MPRNADGLTPKQQRFVEEYLIDLNATQAAIRAGYSKTAARSSGPEILLNPAVSAAVEARTAKLSEKTQITAERVLEEYAKIAFANQADFLDADGAVIPVHKLPRDKAAAIQEMILESELVGKGKNAKIVSKPKLKLLDKTAALRDIARHLGLFSKDAPSVSINVTIGLADRVRRAKERSGDAG